MLLYKYVIKIMAIYLKGVESESYETVFLEIL